MSSDFLRELVQHMHADGDTVAILAVHGKRLPVVVEYVRRPDSQLVHDEMRLLDESNAQQPHSRN